MITTFEVLATVFGILQGLFVMLNKRCNWIFYVLQMASMIVFSYMSHLYGDVVNSSIYLVIGFIGFITWGREGGSKIERASSEEIGIWIAVLCFGSLFGSMLLAQTDDPLPRLDAFTTVSSFVATILMVRHKIETWIVWFVNDICYCVEYWLLPDQAFYLFALNIVWTVMAVVSFVVWRRKYLEQKEAEYVED